MCPPVSASHPTLSESRFAFGNVFLSGGEMLSFEIPQNHFGQFIKTVLFSPMYFIFYKRQLALLLIV